MEVIKQIITDASPKSCDLDPAPTWLVVESVDELLPILSRIITTSLQSSTVPDKFKIGYISPLIKKPGLNSGVETARKESYVTDFRTAENGPIVIQAKNITLPFFSITIIFGILSISWQ